MGDLLDVHGDIQEIYHYDHSTGKSIIQTVQDIEPYLNSNRQELNNDSGNWKGEMHKVASIPMVVIQMWNGELGDNCLKPEYRKWFMAKLKDYNYSKLRTKGGNL